MKNCPYCGKYPIIVEQTHENNKEDKMYDIMCRTKGCYLEYGADWFLPKEELLKKWNKRI